MSDERGSGQWKRRLLPGIANEAGIQILLIPAAGAVLLLLANFILAHR